MKQNKVLKTTLLLTFIIVVSKMIGFVREAVMANTFGLSLESDAYVAAYKLIGVIAILFSVGIGSTIIPIYTKTRIGDGEDRANDYASSVLNLYIIFALLVSVLGYLFAQQLCGLVWQGSAEGMALTVGLTRMMMPSIVLLAVSGVLVNILDARKHFVPEQLIGFALSFCVIIACMVFGSIEAVATATSVSAVVQVVMLLPFMRKNFRYRRKLDIKDNKIKRTFVLAVPALVGAVFDEINSLVDTNFATSMGAGVATALQKSYTLVQAALGVMIVPITTIMFSELSRYAAKKEMGKLKDTVRKSVEVMALITLPIITLAVALSGDLIALFYERGKFSAQDTLFTAPVFVCYIIGIFAFGLRNFLTRVFYSLQKTKIPMIIGISAVGLNILLDFALRDVLGAKGLTLATSIASGCGAFAMIVVLRKSLGRMNFKKSLNQFVRIALCAAVCACVALMLGRVMPEADGFAGHLGRVLLTAVTGFLVYIVAAHLLKVETAGKLIGMVKSKLKKKQN